MLKGEEYKSYLLTDSYSTIEDHLNNVASGDLATNMREAKIRLDEEVSKFSDERLIQALKVFISADVIERERE